MANSAQVPQAAKKSVIVDGYQLDINQVHRCAVQPDEYTYVLADLARERMNSSIFALGELISTGAPVYGVTTGFGDSSDKQIAANKAAELQRNLLRFLRAGTGPCAPAEVIRAAMLIRANSAARGNSAIREELVELLLALLEQDILPCVPERGSVGASGDLAPLSYLAAALVGEGNVRYCGQEFPAANVMEEHGLHPMELLAKEGLALVNGTSFMAAYATLAHAEAVELAFVAELCTALATEVRHGPSEQFAAFPHVHKPHPGQRTSARYIEGLLAGSHLATTGAVLTRGDIATERGCAKLERHIQDPYSIRCAPHVIGVLRDTLDWSGEWLTIEINSSTDNPLIDAETSTVHNSGNFYGGHVAHAAQALCTAVASVADLLDRQLQLIVDEKYSHGLPPNLVARLDADHNEAGLHHGFKGAQITASALTAEALQLTMPAGSFSRSTEAHNQDKVSMGTIAARHVRTAVRLATEVAAVHLLALAQAADLRGPEHLASDTRVAYTKLRRHVSFVERDRPLDEDIACVADLVRTGTFRKPEVPGQHAIG